ncbi:MAG: metallophosphoesterase [Enterovirga sp.]|nr:metallophosphoesterase [Enterovirga sp.]
MAVLFTSDHHFGDHRRLAFDKRPFASVADMDRAMTERWNAAVAPDDVVWHLGDVTGLRDRGRVDALLSSLNGIKHLVPGNNDGPATLASPEWASTSPYVELEHGGRRLVLCHYAFRTWNGMGRGALNLHGHSHGRLRPMPRQQDVGVDVWDFRPVSLDTILSGRQGVSRGASASGQVDRHRAPR